MPDNRKGEPQPLYAGGDITGTPPAPPDGSSSSPRDPGLVGRCLGCGAPGPGFCGGCGAYIDDSWDGTVA